MKKFKPLKLIYKFNITSIRKKRKENLPASNQPTEPVLSVLWPLSYLMTHTTEILYSELQCNAQISAFSISVVLLTMVFYTHSVGLPWDSHKYGQMLFSSLQNSYQAQNTNCLFSKIRPWKNPFIFHEIFRIWALMKHWNYCEHTLIFFVDSKRR